MQFLTLYLQNSNGGNFENIEEEVVMKGAGVGWGRGMGRARGPNPSLVI